jgi:hypothetical protein
MVRKYQFQIFNLRQGKSPYGDQKNDEKDAGILFWLGTPFCVTNQFGVYNLVPHFAKNLQK